MIDYVPTINSTKNPSWTGRNKTIASYVTDNTNIIDLGCGSKDLLNYIKPSTYLGIDYNQPLADLEINFNEDFQLPSGNWDYLVSSGLLEYLFDLELFFSKIKQNSKHYIFTYWEIAHKAKAIKNPKVQHIDVVKDLISQNFIVTKTTKYREHIIFVCIDK